MRGDPSYSKANMTSSGRVAAAGTFGQLRVLNVEGGDDPRVYICHGRHSGGTSIAGVEAKVGNVIDKTDNPVKCTEGIYLEVTGNPRRIECEVLWK